MKNGVFWDVTPCGSTRKNSKYMSSIFMLECSIQLIMIDLHALNESSVTASMVRQGNLTVSKLV
jgi:hypothetical protein